MTRLDGLTVLLTGASGFLGRHVLTAFSAGGATVHVSTRRTSVAGPHLAISGDLADPEFAGRLVEETRPTHVIHLAGTTGRATADAHWHANVETTVQLLRAVARSSQPPWVAVGSSSAVYGPGRPGHLIAEDDPLDPRTTYAASKCAQEMVAVLHSLDAGIPIARPRFFNLVGPGQPETLMLRALAQRVASAERTGSTVVVDNPRARRDFVDVRDAADALVRMAEVSLTGPVNVASGRSRSVAEMASLVRAAAKPGVSMVLGADTQAAGDVAEQTGSFARLAEATGWQPSVPLEESVREALAEARSSDERAGGLAP